MKLFAMIKKCRPIVVAVVLLHCGMNCFGDDAGAQEKYPASDPSNTSGWILNKNISDEFEGTQLDESKWLIQGKDGVYKSNWIGRAPSQFSTDNVRVEDGKLKLETRWDPDFEFSDKRDFSWDKNKEKGTAYENITTAAVICKNEFLYGYMEIMCKAADASITSAFWMTGSKAELDVFEHMGRPAQAQKKKLETEMWSSIHDWSKKGGPTTWTDRLQLDFRVADGFHVYGLEWDKDYLKFYADGNLVRTVMREDVGDDGWVITGPMSIWVDSETFPWHGIPEEADLPVDYEVEYIRVWQKKGTRAEQVAKAEAGTKATHDELFGFEGPISLAGEDQDWWIEPNSREYFSVVSEKAASGKKSLKFTHSGAMANKAVAFAPFGSIKMDAGDYVFSMKVWVEPENAVMNLRIILEDPWLELKPFDLGSIAKGEWVTLKQKLKRRAASGEKDRPRILIQQADLSGEQSTLYIDELSIERK